MDKPRKPTPDFPLFAHNNGQWAKKIGGTLRYFGPWDDADRAAARYFETYGQPLRRTTANASSKRSDQRKRSSIAAATKPSKPHPDYPLYAHPTRRWAKKIRGRTHYFGPWDDPQRALETYLAQKDDLLAGREPRNRVTDGLTLRALLNDFLTAKQELLDNGEIVPRTFADYHTLCERMVKSWGRDRSVSNLVPADFQELRRDLAKTRGPTSLTNDITRIRVVFKYAHDSGLIDTPVRFGQALKRPSKKDIRKERRKKGPRMFEANELRQLLDHASQPLRAMILLGINCGLGNHDCGTLPISALDVDNAWLDFPRPKTEIPRRCPLWLETVEAIRDALKARPKPKNRHDNELLFITVKGLRFAKEIDDNPISKQTRKLLISQGLHRPGLGFYAIRHTFATIAGETRDQVAVDYIMGHAPHSSDMSAVYRERISDERLCAVTDSVRNWLFGKT